LSEKANFSNIYKFYDLINTVLTLGFDKSWRSKAANNLTGTSVLDLGSGTGAAYKQLTEL
jgi:ubiquinone/menaquinone biosynthesis C-methylase UbiE